MLNAAFDRVTREALATSSAVLIVAARSGAALRRRLAIDSPTHFLARIPSRTIVVRFAITHNNRFAPIIATTAAAREKDAQ